jgi:deoxyribodipyrimidine photolyase-related protein
VAGRANSRGAFLTALRERVTTPEGRRWLYVPYDQLTDGIGPLAQEDPAELGILLVESPWKASLRPYHRQKLALVLANQRHFALEQAGRGVAVRIEVARGPYAETLRDCARELGPLRVMEPAERELRADLAPLVAEGLMEILPHEGWLTSTGQFEAAVRGKKAWRMDAFYRRVRRDSGILMEEGKPQGGKFSFDADNRLPWKGEPPAPEPPTFPGDPIKEEVGLLIEERFSRHPGRLDLDRLPATLEDAESLWAWARERCLPHFGPFEDAMAASSRTLFHTRISALLNLHRLLPARVVQEVAELPLPLTSKEGFIRQVLGWREFVRHVHRATDGFRSPPGGGTAIRPSPGDGGYGLWSGRPWEGSQEEAAPAGGADPSFLDAGEPVPPAFWGTPSGLACLDRVVEGVWEEGYGHHITRLMVLANLATLLGISPRDLTDWFWAAYTDAYDWVVEPNVLGMGAFALGDLMTTKPYVSGAAYIDRMSDYCRDCAFNPRKDCPVTPLYWSFLARNAESLGGNPRMRIVMGSLRKRPADRRREDMETLERVREALRRGERLDPR